MLRIDVKFYTLKESAALCLDKHAIMFKIKYKILFLLLRNVTNGIVMKFSSWFFYCFVLE